MGCCKSKEDGAEAGTSTRGHARMHGLAADGDEKKALRGSPTGAGDVPCLAFNARRHAAGILCAGGHGGLAVMLLNSFSSKVPPTRIRVTKDSGLYQCLDWLAELPHRRDWGCVDGAAVLKMKVFAVKNCVTGETASYRVSVDASVPAARLRRDLELADRYSVALVNNRTGEIISLCPAVKRERRTTGVPWGAGAKHGEAPGRRGVNCLSYGRGADGDVFFAVPLHRATGVLLEFPGGAARWAPLLVASPAFEENFFSFAPDDDAARPRRSPPGGAGGSPQDSPASPKPQHLAPALHGILSQIPFSPFIPSITSLFSNSHLAPTTPPAATTPTTTTAPPILESTTIEHAPETYTLHLNRDRLVSVVLHVPEADGERNAEEPEKRIAVNFPARASEPDENLMWESVQQGVGDDRWKPGEPATLHVSADKRSAMVPLRHSEVVGGAVYHVVKRQSSMTIRSAAVEIVVGCDEVPPVPSSGQLQHLVSQLFLTRVGYFTLMPSTAVKQHNGGAPAPTRIVYDLATSGHTVSGDWREAGVSPLGNSIETPFLTFQHIERAFQLPQGTAPSLLTLYPWHSPVRIVLKSIPIQVEFHLQHPNPAAHGGAPPETTIVEASIDVHPGSSHEQNLWAAFRAAQAKVDRACRRHKLDVDDALANSFTLPVAVRRLSSRKELAGSGSRPSESDQEPVGSKSADDWLSSYFSSISAESVKEYTTQGLLSIAVVPAAPPANGDTRAPEAAGGAKDALPPLHGFSLDEAAGGGGAGGKITWYAAATSLKAPGGAADGAAPPLRPPSFRVRFAPKSVTVHSHGRPPAGLVVLPGLAHDDAVEILAKSIPELHATRRNPPGCVLSHPISYDTITHLDTVDVVYPTKCVHVEVRCGEATIFDRYTVTLHRSWSASRIRTAITKGEPGYFFHAAPPQYFEGISQGSTVVLDAPAEIAVELYAGSSEVPKERVAWVVIPKASLLDSITHEWGLSVGNFQVFRDGELVTDFLELDWEHVAVSKKYVVRTNEQ
ncbi:hypothetical protein DIPPA_01073 [Diplonema papillatum]|nr:hypothetical protein DIPPA_01073 [Diplonema papillatum]|eukprot:gene11329-17418_t